MKYYLINNKIMKGSEMPVESDQLQYNFPNYTYEENYNQWLSSLQPFEISESELEKVKVYLIFEDRYNYENTPIDVTDIVECKSITFEGVDYNKIYFKQPKQVDGEIEAVEFAEWLSKNNYLPFNGQFRRVVWESPKEYSKTKSAQELYEIFKNKK